MGSPLTNYEVGAAVEVARCIDPDGNDRHTLKTALRHAATEGTWPYDQLVNACALLVDAALVTIDGHIPNNAVDPRGTASTQDIHRLTAAAAVAIALPDAQAVASLRHLLRSALEPQDHDENRIEVGTQAEEHVVRACRHQLEELGHPQLAAQVQRVSLISDHFGYDVAAPSPHTSTRLLEVKGSTRTDRAAFQFFLSRNEYDAGRRNPTSWALVACDVHLDPDGINHQVTIIGYCRAGTLDPYLPQDLHGRWTEAAVKIPRYLFLDELPA